MEELDDLMTLRQVADYFKVSEITIHRLTQKGAIPAFKIGRQWRYNRTHIMQMVQNRSKLAIKKTNSINQVAF
ncbi:MAG: DNA-binding protein [Candidatus Omnitrophica bacterium CG11_big_fil_rev_8_21_14_0_20_45_26]|uniref:DNA-binding protein n=1 Tax=Candidatus Abzuiibacterium crystallinum TaxID=1974748 RepID=A0A2H0LP70_9BACT|nr:MAG: DNA-binding protein [Candidatus Omnitrophica bacterium CG11_big_fil_rev_8_21_14_0_20_45_26]PIW65294.1 MAG: DNA-binding protein [Candidatus Omnitrophica bacterium CG12_big_fil_rev_8_21_14_0_65_45_16]